MSVYPGLTLATRQLDSLTGLAPFTPYPSDVQTTVSPTGLIIDVATVKQGLPDFGNDADNLIEIMIGGVTEQIERYLGRDLLTRTRKAVYFNPPGLVYLMPVPIASITSVESLTESGTATTLTLNQDYYVRGYKDNLQIWNLTLNGGISLQVTYQTGYGAASAVPAAIKQAIIQETYRQFKRRADVDVTAMSTVDSLSPETQSLIRGFVKRWA